MSVEKIIGDWRKGNFKPVYWLEGEESYYIDQIVNYAEHKLLNEAEAGFNLSIFYGKDADWSTVVNACMRYPMFAERQVVLLKEAQHMAQKELEKLQAYIEHPLKTTILVVSHKEKKFDGRSPMYKVLKTNAEILTTKKMYDNQLPEWTNQMVMQQGLSISPKALNLLVDHIGNDLNRLENEVEKLKVNLGARKGITEDDIETYIGISKEFNPFELQAAIGQKDLAKAIRIIQYFEANPKSAPIQLVLPSIYNFFSKVYQYHALQGTNEKEIAAMMGVNPFFMRDNQSAARKYSNQAVETILLLLHQYNLKSLGVNNGGTTDAGLLKEMVVKMMQ